MSGGEVVSLVGVLCSAVSTVAVAYIGVTGKRDKAVSDARAEIRAEESRLSMDMMASQSELSDVIALAVTGGHTNGNVECARTKAAQSREAYQEFLRKTVAHSVTEI